MGKSPQCLCLKCSRHFLWSAWCHFQALDLFKYNISTTVHATTKSFVLFCSAQDGESTDMNCLVFWAHCKNGKILTKRQIYNKGIFTNLGYFFILWNIDIIRMSSCFWVKWCNYFSLYHVRLLSYSFVNGPKSAFDLLRWPKVFKNISTTVHTTTKSFIPFCSAQDGESTDENCLVFWAHCENGKILIKRQVYNKGILLILASFSAYEILLLLECIVEFEWNHCIIFGCCIKSCLQQI